MYAIQYIHAFSSARGTVESREREGCDTLCVAGGGGGGKGGEGVWERKCCMKRLVGVYCARLHDILTPDHK
jgi:hypothetical protein